MIQIGGAIAAEPGDVEPTFVSVGNRGSHLHTYFVSIVVTMSGPYYYGNGHPNPQHSALSYPQQPGQMQMPGYGYPPMGLAGYPGAYPYPRPGYPPPLTGYPPHPGYPHHAGYPPHPGYPPASGQVMVAPPSAPREIEAVELPHKPYKWVPCTTLHMVLPPDAVMAGMDGEGHPLFVGRAYHDGNMVPGKVNAEKKTFHITFEGEEIAKDLFEVLVPLRLRWRFATDGDVPEGAVESGAAADGETLYVGRVNIDGIKLPGKVQKSQEVCNYSQAGEEIGSAEYEVLVFV